MSSLSRYMQQKKARGEKVFIAYFTAGDPDLATSLRIFTKVAESGADVIELGVPFSDPVGDGPTNQLAADRALKHGTSLLNVLEMVRLLRQKGEKIPIVLFTYFNPIFCLGITRFAQLSREVGVSGVIVVDLPPEEARSYLEALHTHDLDTVFLAAPTTTSHRLALIDKASSGFIYYVSRVGVTGAKTDISTTLGEEMQEIYKKVDKPVVIGFGVSTAQQASQVAALGDGVVIGSAIVKIIEQHGNSETMLETLGTFISSVAQSLKGV